MVRMWFFICVMINDLTLLLLKLIVSLPQFLACFLKRVTSFFSSNILVMSRAKIWIGYSYWVIPFTDTQKEEFCEYTSSCLRIWREFYRFDKYYQSLFMNEIIIRVSNFQHFTWNEMLFLNNMTFTKYIKVWGKKTKVKRNILWKY